MKVIPITPNFVAEIQEIQLDRITDAIEKLGPSESAE